jgi:small subunit ribosomal protein S9
MTEDPQQPEGEAPEEETPQDVTGDSRESAGEEHPGPEIEGAEELQQAAAQVPDADAEAPAEDESTDASAEGEAPEPPAEGESAEAPAEAEAPAADASEEQPPADRPRPEPREREQAKSDEPEAIPGAHLEPDLVLEEQRPAEGEFSEYAEYEEGAAPEGDGTADEAVAEEEAVAHTPLDLAADARYPATGKRKRAVARVILRPGEGTYTINGRHLDEYFPRVRLQRMARQPLEATGNQARLDVVARIHGGGVSAQATALRHGIARALVEADPALRGELKRRGYLTRDPRVKERKKAGLKKARKRPQFSKR